MSIAFFVVLILGIIGVVQGIIRKEYTGSTFWFLTAFWASLVLGVLFAHVPAVT